MTTRAPATAVEKFRALLRAAAGDGTFVKLTLGSHAGGDPTLKNVFVRPIALRAGPRFSFIYRHATRDITKNLTTEEALERVEQLLGSEFAHGHLFTTTQSAQLELREGREARLILGKPSHTAPPSTSHDRKKQRSIDPAKAGWLQALGVTTTEGRVLKGMESKLRQIEKFIELLQPLLTEAGLVPSPTAESLVLADMGCGKGYLTFAACECLRLAGVPKVEVIGIEARAELVTLGNRVAQANGLTQLRFVTGDIAGTPLERVDVLVALHACDTATDDAIARGIRAGARLILVSPCCHKEVRPQLTAPPVLAGALRHGILRERHAEFVTDALRAALLEWAGYETRVFEFISTEHTARNLMIAATKRAAESAARGDAEGKVRALAAFYGLRTQRLAEHLGFRLGAAQ